MQNAKRTIVSTPQIVLITLTGIVLGISIGLYIAAAFIGPAILESAK